MHKILIYLYIINLLKSSTCFEHYPAHLQEVYVVIVYVQPMVSSLCKKVICLKLLCYRLFVCWYRLVLVVWSCRFYYSRWPHCFMQFYFDLFVLVYLSCLFCIANLDDWLTVHRSITLVSSQLDAHILIYLHTIHLLKSSTCFEHYPAHLQEDVVTAGSNN